MLSPEMFSDHGMFMFFCALLEVAASVPNMTASHKSHVNSYTTLCWFIRGRLFFRDSQMISDLFACEHWLQLLINFRSEVAKLSANHVSRFLIFKWPRIPDRVVRWCFNWVCRMLGRLIAESMSFSGYFSFKNIPFKFLHSCERKSCLEDKEGGVRVCGDAVLRYFWCSFAVIFILTRGFAVSKH